MAASLLMFGRSGQVAQCLLERAGEEQRPLRALARADVDVTDLDAVRRAVIDDDADWVVNATAYTAVDRAEEDEATAQAVNHLAPAAMAQACRQSSKRFLHVSTDYVFDGKKKTPYVETDETGPQGVYGATKLAGERAVLAAAPDAVILRTAWVYSQYGANFVKTMLRLGAERDELSVVDDQVGCPTSAADIARAIFCVVDRPSAAAGGSGIYHFAGSGTASWAEFADAIFEDIRTRTGQRPQLTRIPSSRYPTPAKRPANSMLDTSKFERDFGFKSPPWQDSLARVLSALA